MLRSDPDATALQTPEYFDAVLAATGGRDASRLYVLADGRSLVVPLVRSGAIPGISLESGFPGGYGHGGIVASGGLRADDVRRVVEDLRGQALSLRIDGAHQTADQWAAGRLPGVTETARRVEVVDLAGGFEVVKRQRFTRRVREGLRKAERNGVRIERDTTGRLVPIFYQLYLDWVDRWIPRSALPPVLARRSALRQEPRKKFELIAAAMGERCRTFVAWHEDRPVAAFISFVYGQHATGWRAYAIKELAHPVVANTYVAAAAIEDACDSGCRYFDYGQSGGVPELQRFKQSLGAEPRTAIDFRLEAPWVSGLRRRRERAEASVIKVLSRSR